MFKRYASNKEESFRIWHMFDPFSSRFRIMNENWCFWLQREYFISFFVAYPNVVIIQRKTANLFIDDSWRIFEIDKETRIFYWACISCLRGLRKLFMRVDPARCFISKKAHKWLSARKTFSYWWIICWGINFCQASRFDLILRVDFIWGRQICQQAVVPLIRSSLFTTNQMKKKSRHQ